MLSRLVLVTALLAGLALLIQAPARASDRDYYRHERYVEVRHVPAYYDEPRPVYYPRHYRPSSHYHGERYRHAHRYDRRHHRHHHHHHRDHYYSDRRW